MPDNDMKFYKPVPCLEVFTESDLTPQFIDQIHDMQCADMQGDSIMIQNAGSTAGVSYSWNFIIDTCAELIKYTGATNCKPDAEVRQLMNEFIVTKKTATQFFSEKTFIDNNYHTDSKFLEETFVLSNSLAMFNHFHLQKVTNHFSNHLFYNDQFYKTEVDSATDEIVTYNSKPYLSKVYPYGDIHKSMADYRAKSAPIYAPLTVHFSQESTKIDYFATRKCLYEVLQQFGSYYGFTNFLAATFLAAFQRHHLKKSMIKKLYSTNSKEKQDENSDVNSFDTPLDKNQQMYAEDKDMRLKKAITERQSFAYGYWRGYCFELFNKWYCCCCRKREKRQEFL